MNTKTSQPADRSGRIRWVARVAYLAVLLLATLSDLRLSRGAGPLEERMADVLSPSLSARHAADGLRNVVLFAGWGLVWTVTSLAHRSKTTVRNAVLTGAGVSVLVELIQLWSPRRTASFLDVAANSVGALLGAVAVIVAVHSLRARKADRSFIGIPAAVFGVSYGAAVFSEALVPLFRQAPPSGVYGGPVRRLTGALAEFRWDSVIQLPLTDFLLFLPAGVLAVAMLVELGLTYRDACFRVALAGLAFSFLVEVGHAFLGVRIILGAAMVHALGIAAGALIAMRAIPGFTRRYRGGARPLVVAVLYLVVLLLWTLRPYEPELSLLAITEKLTGEWWLPLRAQRFRVDVFSVVDVITGFMLYLPAGALLAVWPVRVRGPLAGCLPAIYVAVATELAQLLVAERTVDVTDIMVQAAAVGIGWIITLRSGFRPYGTMLARPNHRSSVGTVFQGSDPEARR